MDGAIPALDEDFIQSWFPISQMTKIIRRAPNSSDSSELDEIHLAKWLVLQKGLM